MICISSSNVKIPCYKNLQYTSLHFTQPHFTPLQLSTLHFFSFYFIQLHFTTLHPTTLHSTSIVDTSLLLILLHPTTLHPNKLHSTSIVDTSLLLILLHPTLHYPLIWLNPIQISYRSILPQITTLHLTSLNFTSLHYTSPLWTLFTKQKYLCGFLPTIRSFVRPSDSLFPPISLTPYHLTIPKPIQPSVWWPGRPSDLLTPSLPHSPTDPGSETKSFKLIFINFTYSS